MALTDPSGNHLSTSSHAADLILAHIRALCGVLLVSGALFSGSAFAQAPSPPAPAAPNDVDRAMGEILERYGVVAGGWWLAQRCDNAEASRRREFQWNVEQITVSLNKLAPGFPVRIQQSAKAAAEKYECNDETRKLVADAMDVGRDLSFRLTGRKYDAAAEAESRKKRMVMVLFGGKVDDKCSLMPKEYRAEYDGLIARMLTQASDSDRREIVAAVPPLPANIECEKTIAFLKSSLQEARDLGKAP